MKKVLVSVPEGLHERVVEVLKHWGFASKSEFFRHAVTQYLNEMDKLGNLRKGRYTQIYNN